MKQSFIRLFLILLLVLTGSAAVSPALAQAAVVTLTPDAGQKSGAPGASVTFNLAIQAAEDGQYILTTQSKWSVTLSPNQFNLKAGEAASAEMTVVIPPDAQTGQSSPVSVIISRGGAQVGSAAMTVAVAQPSAARPLVVVDSYYLDKDTIRPGDAFRLYLTVKNTGSLDAYNLIFNFGGENFTPQETGGVISLSTLGAGASSDVSQKLVTESTLWGKTSGSLAVKLSYNGPSGEPYTETFNVNLAVLGWSSTWVTATPTPTATIAIQPRAQLVVGSYKTDTDPLQPGTIFNLAMQVNNLGIAEARSASVIIGGGATGSPTNPEGTPQPGGGVSGSGADSSVFASLDSANIQYLGDIQPGQQLTINQKLIVNVSATPGAYTLKLSFVYTDTKGIRQVDDQLITLLVYQVPQIEINFYRDPGAISAMQPNTLPVQVVNLGRKPAVMGSMKVSSDGADLMNNVSLVGNLDAGGYFPLDVMAIPHAAGPLELKITISYTDDFNQPRTVEQTLSLDVLEGGGGPGPDMQGTVVAPGSEGPVVKPGAGGPVDGGGPVGPGSETLWDKVVRFFKGLLGLDSAAPQPSQPVGPSTNPEGIPGPVIKPGGKG